MALLSWELRLLAPRRSSECRVLFMVLLSASPLLKAEVFFVLDSFRLGLELPEPEPAPEPWLALPFSSLAEVDVNLLGLDEPEVVRSLASPVVVVNLLFWLALP